MHIVVTFRDQSLSRYAARLEALGGEGRGVLAQALNEGGQAVRSATVVAETAQTGLPGDTLLMYTDGVSEAMNGEEEEFGEERLTELARDSRRLPLTMLLSGIEHAVEEFHGSPTYCDDFTLLVVRML